MKIIILLCALVIAVYAADKDILSYEMDNQNGCIGLKAVYDKKTITHLICCEPGAFGANAEIPGFTKDAKVDVLKILHEQFKVLTKGHKPCGTGLIEYPK